MRAMSQSRPVQLVTPTASPVSATAPGRLRRRRRGLHIERWLLPYLYLAPALLLLGGFTLGPLAFTFWLSCLDWDLIGPSPRWVGLDNFRRLFHDPVFWIALRNTTLYTLGTVPLSVGAGLALALAIERVRWGRTFYRGTFFLPVIISIAVAALIFELLLHPQIGPVNAALRAAGVRGPNWLSDPAWALPALMAIGVWKGFGYNVVLFIAGLKTIDPSLLEAARIDGASAWQRLRYLTWPLLSPVTFFALIIALIQSFQVFATVQIMTRGGPNNATNVLVFTVWQQAFQFYDVGVAMALATILFLVVLTLTILQLRFGERHVHYT